MEKKNKNKNTDNLSWKRERTGLQHWSLICFVTCQLRFLTFWRALMAEAHRGERGKVCLPCSRSPYADIKHSFVLKTSTHTCFSNSISTLFSLNGKEAQQNPPKVYRLLTFSLIVQEKKETSHNPWHCNINKSHVKEWKRFRRRSRSNASPTGQRGKQDGCCCEETVAKGVGGKGAHLRWLNLSSQVKEESGASSQTVEGSLVEKKKKK